MSTPSNNIYFFRVAKFERFQKVPNVGQLYVTGMKKRSKNARGTGQAGAPPFCQSFPNRHFL
jgi:hypothetical protein